MRRNPRFIVTVMAGAFAAIFGIGMTADMAVGQKQPPFGTKADVDYSKALWGAMVKANLVGPNAINTKPYEGVHPHGAILQTMQGTITLNGHTAEVVVKKNHAAKKGLSVTDVWKDPNKNLKAITVMFKREKGFDSDNQDWFWVKYKADGSLHKNPKGMLLTGRVAKGAPPDKGCINCHKKAGGGDYFFIND